MERNVHFPHVSVACTVTASPLPHTYRRMGCDEEGLGDNFCRSTVASELSVGRTTRGSFTSSILLRDSDVGSPIEGQAECSAYGCA